MGDDEKKPVTPKSVFDTIKDWITVIGVVAGVVAGGYGVFFARDWLKLASTTAAVIIVALIAYFAYRRQKRKQAQTAHEQRRMERESQRKPDSAFRDLAPFEERDQLPGRDRVTEARIIATRIASDDFRFGVVCGDSGCGKTSLLRAEVVGALKTAGQEVSYVRNQRRLETSSSGELPAQERLANELKTLSSSYIGLNARVLILDQFEEWFIEYREAEQRLQLGRFLSDYTERRQPSVKIVAAVRREFLADFHDLADELTEPLLANNLFRIKNFTVDQAIDTITQCAKADGLIPDESFAEMIAHDLSDAGEVRPPELQIVCTYLARSGKLSAGNYRRVGGTAGILAHYIQDALAACREPDTGARLLRALCDFPARAKRKPKTLEELAADVSTEASVTERLRASVARTARQFVTGRILASEQRQGIEVFSLMHDYLVDAVQLATADASTKTEEANQLLRYYVAEKRGRVPFNKLLFIRKFADKSRLADPSARRLVRWSLVAPALWGIGIVAGAVLLASIFFVAANAGIVWEDKPVGNHFSGNKAGSLGVTSIPDGNIVTFGGGTLRKWNSRTAELLATAEEISSTPALSRSRRYFLTGWNPSGTFDPKQSPGRKASIIDLLTMERTQLAGPVAAWEPSLSEKSLYYIELDAPKQNPQPFRLLKLDSGIVARTVNHHRSTGEYWSTQARVNDSGDRMLVIQRANPSLFLYDAVGDRLIAKLEGDATGFREALLNDSSREILTMSSSDGLVIRKWSLETGALLLERTLPFAGVEGITSPVSGTLFEFSTDRSHLILHRRPDAMDQISPKRLAEPLLVLRASDLQTEPAVPREAWVTQLDSGRHAIAWAGADGARIWDGSKNPPQLIQALNFTDSARFIPSQDLGKGILLRSDSLQLWDLVAGKMIFELPLIGQSSSAQFTTGGAAVDVVGNSGFHSLFDANDGRLINAKFAAPNSAQIVYDPACRRFHVWNFAGEVRRYTEGRRIFGLFIPTRCR